MENTGNTKGAKLIIIGTGSIGSMAIKMAEEQINSGEIILVDSVEQISELTGINVDDVKEIVEERKVNPFENPIPYTNPYVEKLTDTINLNEVSNPWPSPKGRRGKKRY